MEPQAYYGRLARLVEATPDFASLPLGKDAHDEETWVSRVEALLRAADEHAAARGVEENSEKLWSGLKSVREDAAKRIRMIVRRAFAAAEIEVPTAAQGAFIPVGADLDVMVAVEGIVSHATKRVLLIDPYMDHMTVTDFVGLVPAGVSVDLLTDEATRKQTLAAAVVRWVTQQGPTNRLAARMTLPRKLHDRLIVIDDQVVYSLTQSLKDFAKRSPGSFNRVDPEMALLKIASYETLWQEAQPLS